MLRVSSLLAVTLVSVLVFVAFSVGWSLSRQQAEDQISPREKTRVSEASPVSSPAVEMPPEDVPGEDIPRMPRYPGSVRVEYRHDDFGPLILTEVEYLTPARMDAVREFYRDVFRKEDWSVADVNFNRGAWMFFVTREEREVFVEIRPEGRLVEVDLEVSEPDPTEPEEPPARDPARSPGEDQSAPQPEQPTEPPPAQAPAPVPADDDDLDDYYEGDYDD